MDALTDLTITVTVDTASARQEIADFRQYALQVIDELKAAYAAASSQVSAYNAADGPADALLDDQSYLDGSGLLTGDPGMTRRF